MSIDISEFELDVQLIGGITIGWSAAHSAVYALFAALSGLSLERSKAIFFAIKQDLAQREMTLALAKVTLVEHPDCLERATSLLKQISSLSGDRNAAIHSFWFVSKEQKGALVINPYAKIHGKLDIENHRRQFLELAAKLNEVSSALCSLLVDLHEHFPVPNQNV